MNYFAQTVDFMEVTRGDTFHITLTIDNAYELTPETRILMQVRPTGDFGNYPVLVFDSQGDDPSVSILGQDITFHKSATDMLTIRTGKFIHDIQFTKDNITSTLYKGIFDVSQDVSLYL